MLISRHSQESSSSCRPASMFPKTASSRPGADVEKAAKAQSRRHAGCDFRLSRNPDDLTVHQLAKSGVALKAVPFAQPGERYSALLGDHVELLYSPIGNIGNFVSGRQMRPILFFSDERIKDYPDIPTAKEAGYAISLPQRRAVVVRTGTPSEIVKTLSDAIAAVVAEPEYANFLKLELASPDSYVPTDAAKPLMEKDLTVMKTMAAKD